MAFYHLFSKYINYIDFQMLKQTYICGITPICQDVLSLYVLLDTVWYFAMDICVYIYFFLFS